MNSIELIKIKVVNSAYNAKKIIFTVPWGPFSLCLI